MKSIKKLVFIKPYSFSMESIYKRYDMRITNLHHRYFGKYVECYGTSKLGYTYNGFWFPPEIVSERG